MQLSATHPGEIAERSAPIEGASVSEPREPAASPRRRLWWLAKAACGIGAPIALYYALRSAGVSNVLALSAGSALFGLLFRRRADRVEILVLVTFTASTIASVVSHDPRFLLAKEGVLTGVWGVWFAGSVPWGRRPAVFTLARPLLEGRRWFAKRSWESLWEAYPQFRRIWGVSSLIWGAGLLIDAVIRVAMPYLLPVQDVPALSGALWPVTFVIIQIVTNIYYHRAGLYWILGARWLRD